MLSGPEVFQIQPHYHRFNKVRYHPFDQWWYDDVLILEKKRFSRKRLVLTAANKDGGAHIDLNEMPDIYKRMKIGELGFVLVLGGKEIPITELWHACVRQIAYEILNSPDIAAFAE